MSDPIVAGTVGLPIRLVLLDDGEVHDPASASVRQITIRRPDGTRHTHDADAGETRDGRACLEYVTKEGDLPSVGNYRIGGYIEDDAGEWPAMPVTITVHAAGR